MDRGKRLASRIANELTQRGSPARAVEERAKLESDSVHLGVPLRAIRFQVNAALRDLTVNGSLIPLQPDQWVDRQRGRGRDRFAVRR